LKPDWPQKAGRLDKLYDHPINIEIELLLPEIENFIVSESKSEGLGTKNRKKTDFFFQKIAKNLNFFHKVLTYACWKFYSINRLFSKTIRETHHGCT